ncbi:peptidoglycan DD-metalloendopeptidase family protein [Seleniivibrio sp.]|uniref:murein hydrolase activator EnvC family protein n=1 Tax=Seleniivibrio sp. TaxID=2898801 RepID=UPI0025ECDBC5|nr:peptidoglycan DD-metalloendopeptidase family protein [Seleniivibrio sp.]MCD8554330.1 peptidoglycan DD-metalloendopeptidase family protein [Seleniivibrio sp.]
MKYSVLLISLFVCFSAFAAKQDKLSTIRQQISKQNQSVKQAAEEKKKMAEKLEQAQEDLQKQQSAVRQMNLKYSSVKSEHLKLVAKSKKLERKHAELIKTIKAANKYMVSSGEYDMLEAVIMSDSAKDAAAMSQIIGAVNSKLYDSVQELKRTNEEIKDTAAELEIKRKNMAKAVAEKKSALDEYKKKKQNTDKMYRDAVKDEKVRKEYLARLRQREKALQAQLAKIKRDFAKSAPVSFKGLSSEFGRQKGKLIWPVHGHVIEKFGVKTVEGFKGVILKKGIKIVPTSNSVKAVYDGVVIHRDNAWGLGNFLIVAHPSGFYSLYANMDAINVSKNEKVKTGQNLGTIDIDHETNTPYLYFEIRIHDKAVDPLEWLASS